MLLEPIAKAVIRHNLTKLAELTVQRLAVNGDDGARCQ
jgi:hypothetical protein